MGMCLALCTLSDANLEQVLADPPLIWKVLAPDDPEVYARCRKERSGGWLARLFGGRTKQDVPPAVLELAAGEVVDPDLDKAWHGIHFLLTGTAWGGTPRLNFILAGGHEVAGVEVGYGTARAFSAAEVRAIAEALAPLDVDALRTRFDPAAMMQLDIYPEIVVSPKFSLAALLRRRRRAAGRDVDPSDVRRVREYRVPGPPAAKISYACRSKSTTTSAPSPTPAK